MLKTIKSWFTQTRLPYVILAVITVCGVGYEVDNIQHTNESANRILREWHGENTHKVHKNQQEILKYRTQLNAMSDEKNTYLTQSMMSSLIRQEYNKADFNIKHVKMPNLSKDPRYMQMSQAMMKQTDYDNDRIDALTQDIHADEKGVRYDHNHDWFTNATHPQKAKQFTKMAYTGGGTGILLIFALWFIYCVANFKNIKFRHFKQDMAEKKRSNYVKEYGDDEGFKENN